MNMEEFEVLVAEVLDSLPEEFMERMENWQVSVEEWPRIQDLQDLGIHPKNRHTLLGLYRGVPATRRTSHYMALPDCITIFKGSIETYAGRNNKEAIREQVRRTIIHEVGHYWGISEKRLRELGWA